MIAGDEGRAVADGVRAGAACKDGLGTYPVATDVGALQTYFPGLQTAIVAILHALDRFDEKGEAETAAWLLLAVTQMAADINRGATLITIPIGITITRWVLPRLRRVAVGLTDVQLAKLLTAFRPMLTALPRIEDTIAADVDFGNRVTTDPWMTDGLHEAYGLARLYDVRSRYLAAVAGIDQMPIEQALETMTRALAITKELDDQMTGNAIRMIARMRNTAAAVTATYVALSLLAEKQKKGEWPAELPADMPVDPASGKPFEHQPGKELRAQKIECGDCGVIDQVVITLE